MDTPNNNDSAYFGVVTIGIIVGILLLIIVIILLVLAVILYIRNLQIKQKNSVNPEAYKKMLHGKWLHNQAFKFFVYESFCSWLYGHTSSPCLHDIATTIRNIKK